MNARSMIVLGIATLALAACIPSVNPWYRDSDVRFAPELTATWRPVEGNSTETWTFERIEGEDAYALRIATDRERGEFRAVLFALGEHRFLDLIATDAELAASEHDIVGLSLIPGHLVLHLAAIEPELELAFIDPEWLEDYIDENPAALSVRIENDRAALTGSTEELQRFLLAHVDGGEMFSDYRAMRR